MRKLTYLAVFEPSETGFGVYFPDLPGCVSEGADFVEAQKMAEEALSLHIFGMEKDGEEIPVASVNPEVDTETASGYFVSPVTVFPDLFKNEMQNRKVKKNVTIPSWLNEVAEGHDVNFSKILEIALKDYLGL